MAGIAVGEREPRLPLVKRLRAQRDFFARRQKYLAEGMTADDASETALADMHGVYGLDLDWAKILEILLMILAMFSKDGPTTG